MPKPKNEKEKLLHELAVMKKIALILFDLTPAQRRIVADAVYTKLNADETKFGLIKPRKKYKRRKNATKKAAAKKSLKP